MDIKRLQYLEKRLMELRSDYRGASAAKKKFIAATGKLLREKRDRLVKEYESAYGEDWEYIPEELPPIEKNEELVTKYYVGTTEIAEPIQQPGQTPALFAELLKQSAVRIVKEAA